MMTTASKHLHIRITVMLSSSDADRAALEMLSLLTAETPAEILGLYMEDIELLSVADLPVAREYCRLTHVERQLNSGDLQRQLRIQARSAQQALAAIAERSGISWSFQTVRGSLASLLQNAAQEMDVMLLGTARRLLPLARHSAAASPPRTSSQPVSVVFDGSESAQRALTLALRIARASGQSIIVFLIAAKREDFARLREQTSALAAPVALRFHELVNPDLGEILAAVRLERTGTLVLGMNDRLISPQSIELLRTCLSCAAVLVK